MTVRVDVWLDFISPFCFLLSNNIQLLEQDRSLDVHWRSLPLRQPSARVSSGTRQIVHAERQYAAEIARATYSLTLFPGPIENTLLGGGAVAQLFADDAARDGPSAAPYPDTRDEGVEGDHAAELLAEHRLAVFGR